MKWLKKWWAEIFPPSEGTWQDFCQMEITTDGHTHVCRSRGPHYDHKCCNRKCGFRWAAAPK